MNNTNKFSSEDHYAAIMSLRQMVSNMVLQQDSESDEKSRELNNKKPKIHCLAPPSTHEEHMLCGDLHGGSHLSQESVTHDVKNSLLIASYLFHNKFYSLLPTCPSY
jgi:hypothetical protein